MLFCYCWNSRAYTKIVYENSNFQILKLKKNNFNNTAVSNLLNEIDQGILETLFFFWCSAVWFRLEILFVNKYGFLGIQRGFI